MKQKGSIVRTEAEAVLGLSRSSVTNVLSKMESEGLIIRKGAGKIRFTCLFDKLLHELRQYDGLVNRYL